PTERLDRLDDPPAVALEEDLVERLLARDHRHRVQRARAVEVDVGQARGEVLVRPAELGAGEDRDAGFVEQPRAELARGVDVVRTQALAEHAEVGEEIERAGGLRAVDADAAELARAPAAERGQHAPRARQVALELLAALERADGGVLNGRAGGREGLARDGRHRLEEPTQILRKDERAEPPPAGAAPLAQAAADDRPLGIPTRDRDVLALVVKLSVNLVRQENQPMLLRDLRDGPQLVRLERRAGRVARGVQDDHARDRT